VPNLFTNEEKIEVQEKMAQIDKQRDKAVQTDGSPVALFNFFVTVGSSDKIYITFLFHPLLILSLRKVFKAPKLDMFATKTNIILSSSSFPLRNSLSL